MYLKPRKIMSLQRTVLLLGTDCQVIDFKEAAQQLMESTSRWHLKINEYKQILIKRYGLKIVFIKVSLFMNTV